MQLVFLSFILVSVFVANMSILNSIRIIRNSQKNKRYFMRSYNQPVIHPFEVDFVEESRRLGEVFCSDSGSIPATEILLVKKSKFAQWKNDAMSMYNFDLLQDLSNVEIKSFPGSRLISIPTVSSGVAAVAFYDDLDGKMHYKAFDAFWPSLKNKTYQFIMYDEENIPADTCDRLAISWALTAYKFSYFKSKPPPKSSTKIVWPSKCNQALVLSMARSYCLMRDLVDTPALSLGPKQLESVTVRLAKELAATNITVVSGVTELESKNFPQIAAVGMASSPDREPRLVDISWVLGDSDGDPRELPEVVIIGKGVTFDTGGLNIKGGGGMRSMKKDMAGSAQALALANLIVETKLPVRLRLLLAIAENSISGTALRPGDVIKARNGKTTEITNTDAEGRLILADALVAAMESTPAPRLVVDFATLTGAARVALGNDLPALFSNDEEAMMRLWRVSSEINDPMWMMPLWEPMRAGLKSSVADLVNAADGLGGAITAALYLSEFIALPSASPIASSSVAAPVGDAPEAVIVGPGSISLSESVAAVKGGQSGGVHVDAVIPPSSDTVSTTGSAAAAPKPIWFHIDFMGSKGGQAEPQGMRAVYEFIKREYC